MRIGSIGAGRIGGTLGRLWKRAGHELHFGTRHPETLADLNELGAPAGTPESAATIGDVVLIAVPVLAIPELAPGLAPLLRGKVVLDAGNSAVARDGDVARAATADPGGSTAWFAAQLPGARVVKAFNPVNFKTLQQQAHQGAVGIPLASDDRDALAKAQQLVRDAGFEPVVVGGLSSGKRFEPGSPVYNTGMDAATVARTLGVAT